MKSVIVIFIPYDSAPTSKGAIKSWKDIKCEGFEVIVISDPARTKVEVEVFFNN